MPGQPGSGPAQRQHHKNERARSKGHQEQNEWIDADPRCDDGSGGDDIATDDKGA